MGSCRSTDEGGVVCRKDVAAFFTLLRGIYGRYSASALSVFLRRDDGPLLLPFFISKKHPFSWKEFLRVSKIEDNGGGGIVEVEMTII